MEAELEVPRDRNGEFEPKLVPKYQRDISGIENRWSHPMPLFEAMQTASRKAFKRAFGY